ncbi:hypothetical protein GCM10009854_47420 [Saccharopolyspora halophila]|uniref:Uncharacterized protein n=1 Tax=Saccharopolyspora halophila TaxID=405551 RepID=A0ABP5TUZ8_9PSEU
MIDSLGDIGSALKGGRRDRLEALYAAMDLHVTYEHGTDTAEKNSPGWEPGE